MMYEIIALVNLVLLIALWLRLKKSLNAIQKLNVSIGALKLDQSNVSLERGVFMEQKIEVNIYSQSWMAKNLETTTFRNGDPIPHAASDEAWKIAGQNKQPAYCYNGEAYGKLYNWYAVNDPRGLAPYGWHIPTDTEWDTLSDYLGGSDVAGKKMKSPLGWCGNNSNGTNEIYFNGLPGGQRTHNGIFSFQGLTGMWWSASENDTGLAYYRNLGSGHDHLTSSYDNKECGFSVRCLRD